MKNLGHKIIKILAVDQENYSLKLKFDDGFIGMVTLNNIFAKPKALAAEIIKGQLFEKCYLESGALAWPNGLELCPDALRMHAQNIKKKLKAA